MLCEEFQDGCHLLAVLENIRKSESPCCNDDSHQVSVQFHVWFWRRFPFEEFQDGWPNGHHGYRNKIVLAFLNLHVVFMPPGKLQHMVR